MMKWWNECIQSIKQLENRTFNEFLNKVFNLVGWRWKKISRSTELRMRLFRLQLDRDGCRRLVWQRVPRATPAHHLGAGHHGGVWMWPFDAVYAVFLPMQYVDWFGEGDSANLDRTIQRARTENRGHRQSVHLAILHPHCSPSFRVKTSVFR